MKNNLTKDSVLAVSQDQVSADLSSEAVILDLKDGVYYELNEVGARIWELIQQQSSAQSILNTLLEEYDVSPQQCEADLLAIAEDMIQCGLAEIKDGPNQ